MVDRGDRDRGCVCRYLGHLGAYLTLSGLDVGSPVLVIGYYVSNLQYLRVNGEVGQSSLLCHFARALLAQSLVGF